MNWYKVAYKSRLISVPLKGTLKKSKKGFIYLSLSNNIVHGLYTLIDEDDIEKPPYFDNNDFSVGAHISVMNEDEFKEAIDIKELGQEFSFKLDKFYSTQPDGWKDMDRVWFVSIIAPELERLRQKYGLSKSYKGDGHKFHFTIAVRKKTAKKK